MFCSNCGTDLGQATRCANCEPVREMDSARYGSAPVRADFGPVVSSPTSGLPTSPPPEPLTWNTPRVSFGSAISAGFRGYVVWNARSTRAEYWWWTLFNFLVLLGALLIDSVLTGGLLYLIAVLALFLPNLSVFIRRLHDLDKSGGWFWFGLIPLVGPIVLLVFVLTPSEMRPTRWNRSLVLDT